MDSKAGEKLAERLKAFTATFRNPAGGNYTGITIDSVGAAAVELGMSKREVEIACLRAGIVPLRYQRNIGSLAVEGQLKLREASVAVIGAGGLGGTVIEHLARAGIGGILIIDGDGFAEENLNRQVLSTEENIGQGKAEAARRRVAMINSAVDVDARRLMLGKDNAEDVIKGCDCVVDALDNIPGRLLLQEIAGRLGIPLVHGAVAGTLGELTTVFPGDGGIEILYGSGEAVPEKGIEVRDGVLTVTPAVIAALQAAEAIKLIVGGMNPLRNRLFCLDLKEGAVSTSFLGGG